MINCRKEYGFNDLLKACWGNASNILYHIRELGLEQEFMDELNTVFDDVLDMPTLADVNDYISNYFDLSEFVKIWGN